MRKVKLLSAALLTAATFATPVLAATSRHVVTDTNGRLVSTMQRDQGDGCVRTDEAAESGLAEYPPARFLWPRASDTRPLQVREHN
jgi:hypothetical protein